jgi:hypothetical protein
VTLYDESPAMRRRAQAHVTGIANAVVTDPASLAPPIPDGFDLVLANSVVQYMPFDALCDWLPRWRSLLARGGRVVLSDVLPTRRRRGEVARELFETLALQARHGLLLYAIRTRLGDVLRYTQARRAAPLTRVEPEQLAWLARGRGFEVDVLSRNLTCRRGRMTMVLSAR